MQINPHYLYNTLEIINMTAIKHENHEVSSMILSLASQFKDMFSIKTNHTTLSQEIDSVKNYFLFINIRYNNRITLDVKLPDALRDIQIVKFILQPLVENSVKHGFCDPSPDRKMNISINIMRTQENFLIISVFDNGRGIEEKKLKSLVKYINNEQSDITIESVGLKNVCERLRLFYGNDFSVEINSFENLGTNILLKIPLSEELENGNGKNQSSSC
jgi:two-component system sensor histidine kinase YesM